MSLKLPSLQDYPFQELGASALRLVYSGARQELLGHVDYSLLVFENFLINTISGEYRELPWEQEVDRSTQIAETAQSLIGEGRETPSVLLLLPSSEFIASSYSMSVTGEKMIRSALQLQAHSSIPAYDDELMLGVDATASQGVALWFPATQADELYRAFNKSGLFLATIMPRSLALASASGESKGAEELQAEVVIQDTDSKSTTLLLIEQGRLKTLYTVSRRDLEQEEFSSQWEQATRHLQAMQPRELSTLEHWTGLKSKLSPLDNYCFLPRGAEQVSRQLQNRKRQKLAGGAAIAAVLALCIPFLSNWMQIRQLETEVENFRQQSAEVRAMQAEVFDMEAEWGALSDYPDQDVIRVLRDLNGYMENALTAFSLSRGEAEIQGYAQDPAYLVELLAEDQAFFNVTQSRNIQGGNSTSRGFRFGVRMNLSAYNFEEYEEQYPVKTE